MIDVYPSFFIGSEADYEMIVSQQSGDFPDEFTELLGIGIPIAETG